MSQWIGQRHRETERADAADRMAGDFERLLRPEHPRPSAERRLGLCIVEPRIAARDEQENRDR